MSLQYKSILKFVTDVDIEYVIVNNARTPKMIPIYKNIIKKPTIDEISRIPSLLSAPLRSLGIRLTAKMLGIRMIKVKESENPESKVSWDSRIVAYSLNWLHQNLIAKSSEKDICVVLDSDMFFIQEFNFKESMEMFDLAFVPQVRDDGILYIWTGLLILKMKTLKNISELDFSLKYFNDRRTDVGGGTHDYLNRYHPRNRELEFINIGNFENSNLDKHFTTHLNGNVSINLVLGADNHVKKFLHPVLHDNLMKKFKVDDSDFQRLYVQKVLHAYSYLQSPEFSPINVDLLGFAHGGPSPSYFILHFKNGSNGRKFQNRIYFKRKLKWVASIVGE